VKELRADRLDCSIHIDVFGAKGLTVDKVWAQNKGKYKSKTTGETTIGGAKAFWVDYSTRKDISSRASLSSRMTRSSVSRSTGTHRKKEIYFPESRSA